MNLFDILSDNERVIVFSDRAEGVLYTWNQSLTLQCWQHAQGSRWEETEIRTLSEPPRDFAEAQAKAKEVALHLTHNILH